MSSFPGYQNYGNLTPSPITSPTRRRSGLDMAAGNTSAHVAENGESILYTQFMDALSATFAPTTNFNDQSTVNIWLHNFSKSEEAWEILQKVVSAVPKCSPEVVFFCANMLYTKIKREWMSLRDQLREAYRARLWGLAKNLAADNTRNFDEKSCSRLCLCLAAAASYTPGGVSYVVNLGADIIREEYPKGVIVAVALIAGIADEILETDRLRAKTTNLEYESKEILPDVFKSLSFLLLSGQSPVSLAHVNEFFFTSSGSETSREGSKAMKAVLLCLSKWAKIGMTISCLQCHHQDLFKALGSLFLEGPSVLLGATVDVFCSMLSISMYPRGSGQDEGILNLSVACVQSRARFEHALAEDDEETCLHICRLASAIGEAETEFVARAEGDMIEFVRLLFDFLSCPLRDVAVITLDFWINLCDVEVGCRHPMLREEVFVSIVNAIVAQGSYPETLLPCSKENLEDGLCDDDFGPFRVGGEGCEMLLFAFYLLKSKFFNVVFQHLSDSGMPWHKVESALWALSVVLKDATKSIENDENAGETVGLLVQLLNELSSNQLYTTNPVIARTSSKLICSMSTLIKSGYKPSNIEPPQLIQPCLSFLCSTLMLKGARLAAASTLKQVCAVTQKFLLDQATIEHLVNVLNNSILNGLEVEGQCDVVDALARTSLAIANRDTSKTCFEALLSPFCSRLSGSLNDIHSNGSGFLASNDGQIAALSVVGDLKILTSGLKHLDRFFPRLVSKGNYIAGPSVQRIWPLVSYSTTFLEDADALKQALHLMSTIVLAFGDSLSTHFEELMKILDKAFTLRPSHHILEIATRLLDVFGVKFPGTFSPFMLTVTPFAIQMLNANMDNGVHRHTDFVRVFFEFAQRVLTFCDVCYERNLDLASAIFELAIVCGKGQERDSTRITLNFMLQMLQKKSDLGKRMLQLHARAVIFSTLDCIADSAPDFLIPYHSDLLYCVFTVCPRNFIREKITEYFTTAVNSNLDAGNRQLVVALLEQLFHDQQLEEVALKHKFKSFCVDFSRVTHGTAQNDLLHAYTI